MGVKTVLFTGSEISKSFLFECAKFYASNGNYISYLSRLVHTALPLPVTRTAEITLPDVFLFPLMTFVTLPELSEFTDYCLNLHHLSSDKMMPKMLIVEYLDKYFNFDDEQHYVESFGFVCACLNDTANYLSKYYTDSTSVYLIISFDKFPAPVEHICKTLFISPTIWHVKCDKQQLIVTDVNFSTVEKATSFQKEHKFTIHRDQLVYDADNFLKNTSLGDACDRIFLS